MDLLADRIIITNISIDPPGTNELAKMEFLDAGIAYSLSVPEPGSLSLLLAGLFGYIFLIISNKRFSLSLNIRFPEYPCICIRDSKPIYC